MLAFVSCLPPWSSSFSSPTKGNVNPDVEPFHMKPLGKHLQKHWHLWRRKGGSRMLRCFQGASTNCYQLLFFVTATTMNMKISFFNLLLVTSFSTGRHDIINYIHHNPLEMGSTLQLGAARDCFSGERGSRDMASLLPFPQHVSPQTLPLDLKVIWIFAVNIVDHDLRASKGVELIELVNLFSYIL